MPEFNVEDSVFHKTHGVGKVVRKVGPVHLKSTGDTTEPIYTVQFGSGRRAKHIPGLYGDELKPAPVHQPSQTLLA